jgi:hypothetical protein
MRLGQWLEALAGMYCELRLKRSVDGNFDAETDNK